MKALLYNGPRDIGYESVDDPALQSDHDAIVRMVACSICGSDLHIYHGHGFSEDVGFCIGHEAVGEVMEVGRSVSRVKTGDLVMMPAAVGCGACRSCLAGNVLGCDTSSGTCYGLSSALQGVQADAFRVPAADMNAVRLPDGITVEQALMMTDALSTAWFGARNADIKPGKSVAVVGLGPIGLMAVEAAYVMGAQIVYAIDPIAERRTLAEQAGAVALDPAEAIETIRDATKGRKLDCVIEAVGAEKTVDLALRLVTKRGTVSVIGVQQARRYAFPLERAFAGGLTFRLGTCSVPEELPALFPLVQSGRLRPERYISHRLPLSAGAEAYAMFDRRDNGALKMVLTPD
ncbi:alcohol dehydrogenase family protein [Sphingobium sp. HBC34]|uniref:Alcohol dehydrogenase family protein n=1 Tax=Sphingobium cyanobacteriorum TaxID=3063954 RepID=A0ABT8ZPF2_9SPHN|nr:alcohol dehydrogenase family protein [Sphingobium sp. HBC34]MDO7836415.1 alcohol dehydrogenase family protein [Sphingobium sp. HBC34]